MKKKYPKDSVNEFPKINLQRFAEPNPDDDILDDIEEEEEDFIDEDYEEEDGNDEKNIKKTKKDGKKKEKKAFLEGIAETPEEAKEKLKIQKRYIRKLEEQISKHKKETQPQSAKEDVDPLNEISDEEIIANPRESVNRIVDIKLKRAMEQVDNVTSQNRWAFFKSEAQKKFPDFDIDTNQDDIYKEVMRYSEIERKRNGFQLLCDAIKKLGGKEATQREDTATPSEDGSAPSVSGKKGGNPAKQIKDSIVNAQPKYDLFSETG